MEDPLQLEQMIDYTNYHFVIYRQNNSGGNMIITPNLGNYVIFYVTQNIDFDNIYEKLYDYFDTIMFDLYNDYEADCDCCGSRWERYKILSRHQFNKFINSIRNKYSYAIHDMKYNETYNDITEYDMKNIMIYDYQLEKLFLNILYKKLIREGNTAYHYIKYKIDKKRLNMSKEEAYFAYQDDPNDMIINKMFTFYNRIDWLVLSKNKIKNDVGLLNKLFIQPTDIIKKIILFI
jgi:hypothetical protein